MCQKWGNLCVLIGGLYSNRFVCLRNCEFLRVFGDSHEMLVMKQVSFLSSSNPICVLSNAWMNCNSTNSVARYYLQAWHFRVTFYGESDSSGNCFQCKDNDKIVLVFAWSTTIWRFGEEWSFGSTLFELPLDLRSRPYPDPGQSARFLMNMFVSGPHSWLTCFFAKY